MWDAVFRAKTPYLFGLTKSDVEQLREPASKTLSPEETKEIDLLQCTRRTQARPANLATLH
jgi:hypothetical protein